MLISICLTSITTRAKARQMSSKAHTWTLLINVCCYTYSPMTWYTIWMNHGILVLSLFMLATVFCSVYAVVLIYLRSKIFHVPLYKPMLINICLAWLPVVVTILFLVLALALSIYWLLLLVLAIGLCVWLVVFPNAHYLVTELNLSHRTENDPVPLYYDIMQTLVLTLSGIMIGQLSLVFVHAQLIVLLTPGYSDSGMLIVPDISWAILALCIVLGSFAIYIGRNIRLNSWDVLRPLSLVRRIVTQLKSRSEQKLAIGYVCVYGIFMMLFHAFLFGGFMYLLLDIR